ncbi:EAL domain-containing protein (putative c-di-GMP-specific phosphodiesterase class I) [Asanoa ferruginea]|uniref:EAL domain-containing protein (Putative c-di-GMP-specific phosphodiesterase class I) n=1 Tax=Asanoa ferruginea TaxID=53367 RepID=A0A3D9ZZ59_9ACTN|nr:EAL domain-containing protein (putative c-di-GMP-specific phosphodiesterase class I) [Asanoa ferruginea]
MRVISVIPGTRFARPIPYRWASGHHKCAGIVGWGGPACSGGNVTADLTTCVPAGTFVEPATLCDHVATLARERRTGFAVARLGIYDYREIRSSLGPAVATELLDRISARIADCLDERDAVSVLPDGDLLIVLDHTDHLDQRLRELVARGSGWTSAVYGQLSAGAAAARPGEDGETVLSRASLALEEASRRAPGAVTVCSSPMMATAQQRVSLDIDLRRAVEADRLTVHYQPVVALDGGRIVGYEALARWPDQERGWVSPDAFIPAAERNGLISDIGLRVLRQALRDKRRYGGSFDTWLSVNVSVVQLDDDTFADQVLRAMADEGMSGEQLRIEVTESALLASARSRAQLIELRRAGIRVLVDDFGTGFSSLASVRRLPIDGIKISRELLHDEEPGLPDPTVVRAVRLLAAGAGVTDIIAEGVESALEVRTLAALGMPYAQGFHLGRPAPASRALRWPLAPASVN